MLLVDTGPLYAVLDRSDPDHAACVALFESRRGRLVTTGAAIVETCLVAERRLRDPAPVVARFLRSIAASEIAVVDPAPDDLRRTAELVLGYRDLGLGVVDAGLVALAEALDLREIATLDHRHFAVVQPAHVDALVIVP